MATKVPAGVEMRVFSKSDFFGTSTSIHLIIPISIDFDDVATRHHVYFYWNQNQCLPPQYDEANAFIEEVKSIAGKIDQIMLGSDFCIGNYIELVISKQGSKMTGVIKKLQWLINPKTMKKD